MTGFWAKTVFPGNGSFSGKWLCFFGERFFRENAVFPGTKRFFRANGGFSGLWPLFPGKMPLFRAYGCFSGNGEFSGHMSVFSEIMAAFFREYVRFCTERRLCYADRPLSRCRVTFFPHVSLFFPGKAINSVLSKLMLK